MHDLYAALLRLNEAGHELVVPKKTIRPGVTTAFVTDPHDNWVKLLHNSA